MNTNKEITVTVEEIRDVMTLWANATPEAQAAAREMLEKTTPTTAAAADSADLDDEDGYRELILQAFDHATNTTMNEDTKAEALQLARLYLGLPNMPASSPMLGIMTGFLMGMSEGMRIAETLDKIAAERAAAQ